MPPGRLNEKYVQRVAVDRLAAHYASRPDVLSVLSEREVVVRYDSELGSGRADGVVAVVLSDGSVYTAALEAKSARTLANISLRYRDEQWLLHALAAGLLGLFLTGSMGWLVGGSWLLRWALPVVVFFAVTFAYLLITQEHARYRLIDVMRQVKRYPANERWIAVSADAYNRLADDLRDALHSECRSEGIGLLRVRTAAQIAFLEEPSQQRPPKGINDFLECYARSNAIRQRLRTMAETRK
jgi:hypothetical protein